MTTTTAADGVRIRDHLANVRTFLAWLRIGLVLLALGFAVAELKVAGSLADRYVGLLVAVAGLWVIAIAGAGFTRRRRAIESREFSPLISSNLTLSLVTAGVGVAVLIYLFRS